MAQSDPKLSSAGPKRANRYRCPATESGALAGGIDALSKAQSESGLRGHQQSTTPRLLGRLLEVSQIRRRLPLLERHQEAIRAHVIAFLADEDLRIVLRTNGFGPVR